MMRFAKSRFGAAAASGVGKCLIELLSQLTQRLPQVARIRCDCSLSAIGSREPVQACGRCCAAKRLKLRNSTRLEEHETHLCSAASDDEAMAGSGFLTHIGLIEVLSRFCDGHWRRHCERSHLQWQTRNCGN
jgi:hypothetical protein